MKFIVILLLGVNLLFALVDINTASKKELSGLPGIGTSKSDAIILYRKEHCFKTIKELSNVKGIGDKTIEKNKNNLTASACKK